MRRVVIIVWPRPTTACTTHHFLHIHTPNHTHTFTPGPTHLTLAALQLVSQFGFRGLAVCQVLCNLALLLCLQAFRNHRTQLHAYCFTVFFHGWWTCNCIMQLNSVTLSIVESQYSYLGLARTMCVRTVFLAGNHQLCGQFGQPCSHSPRGDM